MTSLNINGLNNGKKRSRAVILIQETHLTGEEHLKFRRMGYRHAYFSSNGHKHNRGVMILISNTVKFELIKEINDREGRYVMVIGKVANQMVTILNVYALHEVDGKKSLVENV